MQERRAELNTEYSEEILNQSCLLFLFLHKHKQNLENSIFDPLANHRLKLGATKAAHWVLGSSSGGGGEG